MVRNKGETGSFVKWELCRISTGSRILDSLLGGGLPFSSITDIFGASATGKTQFAFQNAVMTCKHFIDLEGEQSRESSKPAVVFVDCAGSFRPERIAEIATHREVNPDKVLDLISSVYARSISDQRKSSDRLLEEDRFSRCRLIIVDDVTTNFSAELNEPDQIIQRQFLLSTYVRKLSYIANRRGTSVLLTNSVRSRADLGQGETTGEMISQYTLFRVLFKREDRTRIASVEQPIFARSKGSFEIDSAGITP
jgi:DNA repair protein RadA